MSEINCLISCTAFRNTSLAATRLLRSIITFLQSVHLSHGLKSIVTNSNCSFLTFWNTITGLSSYFVCPPCLKNWHSLPLYIHWQSTFPIAPSYSSVAICCYVECLHTKPLW